MNVAELLQNAAQNPSRVSRRSGVSRSTIKRIIDGDSQPTLATLRELALAQGFDLEVTIHPAADPLAALAARSLVEPAMAQLRASEHPEIDAWVTRFQRYGIADPDALTAEAGLLSTPTHHPDSIFFAPRTDIDQERATLASASAAQTSHTDYVISGAPAAVKLLGHPIAGPVILWTSDPEPVAQALAQTFRRAERYQPAGIVVASAPPELFIDAADVDRVRYAAPVQVVIDLHGIGAGLVAAEISEGW